MLPGARFPGFGEPLFLNNPRAVQRHLPCSQGLRDDRKGPSERMWPLTAFFASPVSAQSANGLLLSVSVAKKLPNVIPNGGGGVVNGPTFSSLFRSCSSNGSRKGPREPRDSKNTQNDIRKYKNHTRIAPESTKTLRQKMAVALPTLRM